MKKIYAPWRHKYVSGTVHIENEKKKKNKKDCVFCSQFAENNDEKYFIIKRFDNCALVMNLYPYNAGHLMVIPFEHKPDFQDFSSKVRNEMMDVVNSGIKIVQNVLKPQGFNVGFNTGIAGGGGIPSHFHIHIIPRWSGDTNFLATIGETKVICSDFNDLYKQFKSEIEKITI
ncbi:MAG: HIT domain-containing protein [bacterium]